MTIPALPVKFVIYKSQEGFDSLENRDEFTLYFVRETLGFYQGDFKYSDVITVEELPEAGIPLKIYLVADTEVYLRASDSWIHLNEKYVPPEGGVNEGVGITLNGAVIGGVKNKISLNEKLIIPEDWQYRVRNSLSLEGDIVNNGEIFIE